jgi:outer membrane protein TolC
MMKNYLLILILLSQISYAQRMDSISLDMCYIQFYKSYPGQNEKQLLLSLKDKKLQNLKTAYYPQASFNARATYQSDVIEFNIPNNLIQIQGPEKDQYNSYIDIKQMIYDGGINKARMSVEEAWSDAESEKINLELHQYKSRINDLYFSILYLQEKLKILDLKRQLLQERIDILKSGEKHGSLLKTTMYQLYAEFLVLKNEILTLNNNKSNLISSLGSLIQLELDSSFIFTLEEKDALPVNHIERPEHTLFEKQKKILEDNKKIFSSARKPLLYGFVQAGYGKPGLNFINDKFDTYYQVGVGLSWNITDWNQTERNKAISDIQIDIINKKQESFDLVLQSSLIRLEKELLKYDELLARDKEITKIREKIRQNASIQLDNGVISVADYLVFLNEESESRIKMKIHELDKQKCIVDYYTFVGL